MSALSFVSTSVRTLSQLAHSVTGRPYSFSIANFIVFSIPSRSTRSRSALSLKRTGMSLRNTPLSMHSTWPPMYVSLSSSRPPYHLSSSSSCLLGAIIEPRFASTCSSDSHNVPLPFLSTSAGDMGMIVESENMKKCTNFM